MDKNDYSFDWYRLLMGDHPPTYLLEIVFRVAAIYVVTLAFLRWAGKRTLGELTFFDFAIIIALGSAVGDGMIFDDVPLMHSFVVIACVISLERLIAYVTEDNKQLEKLVEGEPALLVEDGVIVKENMHGERLSRDELFEGLRRDGIHHLGEVAVAYLERSGKLSVVRLPQARPGLSVLPQGKRLCTDQRLEQLLCCKQCGTVVEKTEQTQTCPNCEENKWTTATCDIEQLRNSK